MGEGRRPEIVLTLAENSASKFYQLSSEAMGGGAGCRDECGGETWTCMVMSQGSPCPCTPAPDSHFPRFCAFTPRPGPQHCFTASPVACGELLGRGQVGSRARNQGQDWEILNSAWLFFLHTLETWSSTASSKDTSAKSQHVHYPPCTKGKPRHSSVMCPMLHLKHRHTGRKRWPWL